MAQIATETRASRPIRLDPYQAPHRIERGNTKIQLDHGGAVVKKTLSCGLPLSLAVPARAFKGLRPGLPSRKMARFRSHWSCYIMTRR